MKITDLASLNTVKEAGLRKFLPGKLRIAVGMDTCGIGNDAEKVFAEFQRELKAKKVDALLTRTGCFGYCSHEPIVNIRFPGKPLLMLNEVKAQDVKGIVAQLAKGEMPLRKALCRIEQWDPLTGPVIDYGKDIPGVPLWNEVPFFKWQKKIVLRESGLIDPEDIEEYIAVGGYSALYKALREMAPQQVIEEVKKSKLRGRGGAGFPTGRKWELMAVQQADKKYIICNADEGDPGAYMNRNEIESDPHMLIEGMIIGAYAMGAGEGVVYIRAEYPLAVQRLKAAIAQAKEYGLLGQNICGSPFSFDLTIVEGAGAFVCGEETALIASIEGKAGRPRLRPPFPAQKGLFNRPTDINNVETWCNVPVIIAKGGDWFLQTGTQNSPGTKVFSLVGKIRNTGLVELPLGQTLQTLVYAIGGGSGSNKSIKAVQTGGPSGGCVPAELFNTPVDYESLTSLGTIMGSGGVVVMDTDNCMVDVARYFTEFTTSESCGKCTPCREGLSQALAIIEKISEGKATQEEVKQLQEMGDIIKDTALCGLGQTGPNPVLTTYKYFRKEYDEHIEAKRCDAGVCASLFLSPCENSCPLHMNIPGFLTLLKSKKLVDSFESILRDNPLPASTGRICHFHCKMRCRREDIDQPVSQGEVHRYVADVIYRKKQEGAIVGKLVKEKLAKTGKKISVVGAGPAGITCAYYLARLGHDVTVYESTSDAGGILRWGIPEYRLPKVLLAKEIGFIRAMGVKFVYNRTIGAQALKKLEADSDIVFVATGAYKSMALKIPGEDMKGVHTGTGFLDVVQKKQKASIGRDVIIIGAGNVAVDAARTAWRLGAQVTIVYRREKDDMPANRDEISEAENEGIKFVFLAGPREIIGDAEGRVKALKVEVMKPGEYDLSGRRRPEPTGETYEIPCDTVLVAIGERVDPAVLNEAGLKTNKDGTAAINDFTLKASLPGFYAGGDVVTGPSTAVEAMADGKKAAREIDRQLMGKDRFGQLFRTFAYDFEAPAKPDGGKKQTGKRLLVRQRKGNFKEVSLGLSPVQAAFEARRCLRCDAQEVTHGR
ncbi:MAG: FAD-dependent oxidoreductase [Deltaproteobacteria bacterium]